MISHFGICFPVATLTGPHDVTAKSPSKPLTLLPAQNWRVGLVAREGASGADATRSPPAMLAVTGAFMVLAAGSGIVGLVMGLRILCQEGDPRGQTTSAIFFLCAEEGGRDGPEEHPLPAETPSHFPETPQ